MTLPDQVRSPPQSQRRPRSVGGAERGSASVELALVVPALVLMLGLLVAGGRVWLVKTAVSEAAATSARAASLARSAGAAAADGRSAATASLATAGVTCSATSITVDATAFARPPGTPATVRSSVACTVSFADVFLPGIPGSRTFSATGSSALDTYRARR